MFIAACDILEAHINKFIAYFCNSDCEMVQDLNYLDTISDAKAKAFVSTFYAYILKQTRVLLGKMDTGEIEITHDFYLKTGLTLNYDNKPAVAGKESDYVLFFTIGWQW